MAGDEIEDHAPDQDEKLFAERLREAREGCNMSQEALAARMRRLRYDAFRQQTIASIEGGLRSVRLGEARMLARLVGSDLEMLLRPPEEFEAARNIASATREARSAHAEAHNLAAEFLASRAALRHYLAEFAGLEASMPDLMAAAREAAALRLRWEQ